MHADLDDELSELLASGRVLIKRLDTLMRASKSRAACVEFQDGVEGAIASLERGVGQLMQDIGECDPGLQSGSAAIARRMVAAVAESPVDRAPAPERAASADTDRAVLRGSSDVISVADLLEWLGAFEKTGVLEIETPKETITIELRNGRLVHAMTNRAATGERLGDILVRLGYVTEQHLEAFVRGFVGSGRPLGEVLESGALVTADQLATALTEQVQRVFLRLFSAERVTYTFRMQDEVHAVGNQKVELGLRQLLFESARITDEQSYL